METVNLSTDGSQLLSLQQNAGVIDHQLPDAANNGAAEKKKVRHVSALSAAAGCRSAVQHAHLHIISNKPGDFAHSATNICYDV